MEQSYLTQMCRISTHPSFCQVVLLIEVFDFMGKRKLATLLSYLETAIATEVPTLQPLT